MNESRLVYPTKKLDDEIDAVPPATALVKPPLRKPFFEAAPIKEVEARIEPITIKISWISF